MTCTAQTINPKTHPLLTSKLFHSKKAGTKNLFFGKNEVILDHAVEVRENARVTKKETTLSRLNRALVRSLKGYFDVTYK